MASQFINIGLGNYIITKRVVAIVPPNSAPMRRLKEEAKREGRLIDASQGKKTRSFIVTDSNHVILSSVSPDTLTKRLENINEADE